MYAQNIPLNSFHATHLDLHWKNCIRENVNFGGKTLICIEMCVQKKVTEKFKMYAQNIPLNSFPATHLDLYWKNCIRENVKLW